LTEINYRGTPVAIALEQFRKRPAVSFSDCLILEIARKAGHLPLGTFDRGLAKLPDAQRL
jgi:predicted nucleic acid-binding protein